MTSSAQELIPDEVSWGDLGYLARYQNDNSELVADRAAGSIRIEEDLIEAAELTSTIAGALAVEQDTAIIFVPARQHKILGNSRRIGGFAIPPLLN